MSAVMERTVELIPNTPEPVIIEDDDVYVVRRARDFISDPDKWCSGTVLNKVGQRCAIGAMYAYGMAPNFMVDDRQTYWRKVARVLGAFSMIRYRIPSIVNVNDAKGREAAIQVFDDYLEWRKENAFGTYPPGYNTQLVSDLYQAYPAI